MSQNDTSSDVILVDTGEAGITRRRGGGPKELKVEVVANNVNLFLNQMGKILEDAPSEVGEADGAGKFRFTEFVVTAEITGKGILTLLGTGVEATAKGGLTFRFQKT